MNKKYAIATIKSWNLANAKNLSDKLGSSVFIYDDPKELTYENLKTVDPRYVFFPHWSWMIPKEIYESWECVVFHMTDLPFGRGGSPLQNMIDRGIYNTKISAIKVVKELDAGPIYLKQDLDLSIGSAQELYKRASNIVFDNMIPYIIKKEPKPQMQNGEPVVFKRRTPQQSNMSHINNARKAYDFIRMLDAEGYPSAFIENGRLRIEFSDAKLQEGSVIAQAKISVKGAKSHER